MSENWFKELFIDEAKPALSRHSGGGGGFTDVEVLPTENIEKDKIYRVTTQGEETAEVWVFDSDYGFDMSLEDFITAQTGYQGEYYYHIVDTTPSVDSMIESADTTLHIYIAKDTGEQYLNMGGITTVGQAFSMMFRGIASDKSDMVEAGCYTIFTTAGTSVTYGIPAPVYQHDGNEWKEMGGGSGGGLSLKLIAENLEPDDKDYSGMMFFVIGQELQGKTLVFRLDLRDGKSISFTIPICGESTNVGGTNLVFQDTGVDGDIYMAIIPHTGTYMYSSDNEPTPGLFVDVRSMPSGTQIGDTARLAFQPKLTVYSLE